ncbi:hypothetical protein AB0J82_17015 [Asanoa sp. NPDC049518]|uniref:hypothetical protein n=1 Tax=unclassified Asanoa TaxID=2685164 RepID=UPI003428BD48
MTDLTLFLQLQARIATFLAEQPAERLLALAEGRAMLSLVDGHPRAVPDTMSQPPPANVVAAPGARRAPAVRRSTAPADLDADAIAKSLRAKETLDEATEELAGHKLTVGGLKLVVRALGLIPKGTKADITRQIINQAVGARRKYDGLRQG